MIKKTVHHIIARGIERGEIFRDDQDRDAFLKKLGELVVETKTQCFAWALIPNHFHLLLKTGNVPITTVMRRLMTSYAIGHYVEGTPFTFLHLQFPPCMLKKTQCRDNPE